MANVTRLEQELADALGLAQAVRSATARAREKADDGKVLKRLDRIDADLDRLQEEVNAVVVGDPAKRTALTGRSRRVREADDGGGDGDVIDAAQRVVAASAHHLAQWTVVGRMAKRVGDRRARSLATWAMPMAEEHVAQGLKACKRLAKRAETDAPAAA